MRRRACTELLNRAHRILRRSCNSSRLIARDFATTRGYADFVTRSKIIRARPDVQSIRCFRIVRHYFIFRGTLCETQSHFDCQPMLALTVNRNLMIF